MLSQGYKISWRLASLGNIGGGALQTGRFEKLILSRVVRLWKPALSLWSSRRPHPLRDANVIDLVEFERLKGILMAELQ